MVAGNAKHVSLAGPAQDALDLADAIDGIGGDPGERHASRHSALDHPGRQPGLGCEADINRHMGAFRRAASSVQLFGR